MNIILVSIISDQLIPNLLFIKERQDVGHHIFVTTKSMEAKSKSDILMKVAGLTAGNVQKVTVLEDSLDDIRQKLDAIICPTDTKYLLNLTGGTKIMSIGVNRFFEEFDHESYYAAIGRNSFKRIFPRDNDREQPFSYSLILSEYLESYGFRIEKNGLPFWATESLATQFFQKNLTRYRADIKNLRIWQQENQDAGYVLPNNSNFHDLLQNVGWKTQKTGELGLDEIQFIISGWWEAFIFYRLKKDLNLLETSIAVNCHISRSQTPNELDIAFVKNNKLFMVECKTGFAPHLFKDNFNNAIYKMAALRKDLGLRIPGFLCMLDSKLRENGEIKSHFTNRAIVMDTELIDKKILDNLNIWQKILQKIK